ncbi:hypothetical protein AGLY_002605, partial [Aphis glycines]
ARTPLFTNFTIHMNSKLLSNNPNSQGKVLISHQTYWHTVDFLYVYYAIVIKTNELIRNIINLHIACSTYTSHRSLQWMLIVRILCIKISCWTLENSQFHYYKSREIHVYTRGVQTFSSQGSFESSQNIDGSQIKNNKKINVCMNRMIIVDDSTFPNRCDSMIIIKVSRKNIYWFSIIVDIDLVWKLAPNKIKRISSDTDTCCSYKTLRSLVTPESTHRRQQAFYLLRTMNSLMTVVVLGACMMAVCLAMPQGSKDGAIFTNEAIRQAQSTHLIPQNAQIQKVQEGVELVAYESIPGSQAINLFEILGDHVPPEVVSNLQTQVDQVGKQ